MTEPPTAPGAREAAVREWDVGFGGFTGGALPHGDRGRGVSVGMAEGGRWSPAVRRSGGGTAKPEGPLAWGQRMPVSISTCNKKKKRKAQEGCQGLHNPIACNPHNSFMGLETLISTRRGREPGL